MSAERIVSFLVGILVGVLGSAAASVGPWAILRPEPRHPGSTALEATDRAALETKGREAVASPVPPPEPERVAAPEPATLAIERPEEAARRRAECDRARFALDEWRELLHPFDRYYAEWLTLPEAQQVPRDERATLRLWLTKDAPCWLRPGEAAVVLDIVQGNWRAYGGQTVQESLILTLGPQRVLEEAPDEWARELATWYDEAEWLRLFGSERPQIP